VVPPGAALDVSLLPHDIDPVHTSAETPVFVVVLTVDIGRNGPSQRDKFSSRRDHWKPATRQESRDDVGEQHPGLCDKLTGDRIKRDHAIEVARLDSGGGVNRAV